MTVVPSVGLMTKRMLTKHSRSRVSENRSIGRPWPCRRSMGQQPWTVGVATHTFLPQLVCSHTRTGAAWQTPELSGECMLVGTGPVPKGWKAMPAEHRARFHSCTSLSWRCVYQQKTIRIVVPKERPLRNRIQIYTRPYETSTLCVSYTHEYWCLGSDCL